MWLKVGKVFRSRPAFYLTALLLIVLGIYFRIQQIDKQIIGGDEWNAIRFACKSSYGYIFTNFNIADNCIPLTAYYKLLLETIGLNDIWLRSLQLLSGISCLIIFPVLVKKFYNRRVVLIFTTLLAISPFLIFYSRYARPYIIVVLLSFLAVFYYYLWMIKGHTRYIICYLICAIVSPYFNLFSTAVVLGPLIYTLLLMLMRRIRYKNPEINICIDLKKLLMVISITIIGISIWLIPTFDSLNALANKINRGSIGLNTIACVLNNVCGVGNDILSMVCFSLIPIGLYIAYRKNRLLGSYAAFLVVLNIVLIMIIRPAGVHYPMVFSRYFIASIPLCLLAASIAIDEIANRVETFGKFKSINIKYILHIIMAMMMFLLFFNGPLLNVCKYPNNFTNHGDFQSDYKHTLIKNTDKIYGGIPEFYRELKSDDGTVKIIEAPFLSMWLIHNYHIYQIIHEKEVMIGHDNISYLSPPRIVMNKNIIFECFVNIDSKESIKESGAEYIIVHKDVAMERDYLIDKIIKKTQSTHEVPSAVELIDPVRLSYSKYHAKAIIAKLYKMFEKHYYEDEWITVFRVVNRK